MTTILMDLFTEISYQLIWLFSYIEIMQKKMYNNIIVPLTKIELFESANSDSTISFVKDGDIIYECTREDAVNFDQEFDFLVDATKVHRVVHTSIPADFNEYETSNVDFILTELVIGDDRLNIKLISNANLYSYAVVNNIIDTKFLMYFIRKHYLEEFCTHFAMPVNQLENGYTLKIIDNNVNMLTLQANECLLYLKDTYVVGGGVDEPNSDEPNISQTIDPEVSPSRE